MKNIILLLTIILCCSCASQRVYICGGQISDLSRSSLIKLRVLSVSEISTSYEISQASPRVLIITKYTTQNCEYWSNVIYKKSHNITENQYEEIIKLLKVVLARSPVENATVLDGEEWMLESSFYNYTAITYLSPDVNPEERGLIGIINLKNYLSKFEN